MSRRHRIKNASASQDGAAKNVSNGAQAKPKESGEAPALAPDLSALDDGKSESEIVGYVNFDGRGGDGNVAQVLIDAPFINRFRRGRYVTVRNYDQRATYLGRVVEGPYFSPDFVSVESSIARVAIQKAATISMLPDYHAYASVEILGEIADGALLGVNTRPLPKSVVKAVDGDDLRSLLRIDGDLRIGRLDGYAHIAVHLKSDAKSVLPRNVGIFGTVGSGKTNTSQVLIEELSRAGWAVIVLDVEGEYVEMDQPTTELHGRLTAVGKKPQGLQSFRVYYPVGHEPDDSRGTPFAVDFGKLPAAMVAEIVGMNDAQQERFFQLYDACARHNLFGKPGHTGVAEAPKKSRRKSGPLGPTGSADRESSGTDDGIVAASDAVTELELVDSELGSANVSLRQLMEKLLKWLQQRRDDSGLEINGPSATSWQKVKAQLRGIHRLGIFPDACAKLDMTSALVAGRVSVIDLSDSADPRVNNLVIADVLRSVFDYKKQHPNPKVMIVIEEAHTFVSRDSVRHMQATMDKLREIARRGRKRWLGLTFISQQPSHLPPELYELCNTLFVHETNGRRNVDALKGTAGTVNEGIWKDISVLGQGRSVVVSPQYRHPLVVQIDPATTKRRHIE